MLEKDNQNGNLIISSHVGPRIIGEFIVKNA